MTHGRNGDRSGSLLADANSAFTTLHAEDDLTVLEQCTADGDVYRWLCRRQHNGSSHGGRDGLLAETVVRVVAVAAKDAVCTRSGPRTTFDRNILLPQYHVAMVAALGLCELPLRRALFLGVGGGALVMHVRERHPACICECVEPDERALDLGQRYFGLRPGPGVRLHSVGAAEYVRRRRCCGASFDAIFLDASTSSHIDDDPNGDDDDMRAPPPSLRHAAVLRELFGALHDGGVLAVNALAARGCERGVAALRAEVGAVADATVGLSCEEEGNHVLVGCSASRPGAHAGLAALPRAKRSLWLEACAQLGLGVT